jgi:hypothetical protein
MAKCAKCNNWHGYSEDCPPYRPGDRVKLVSMKDDPDPIPAGSLGTVIDASSVHLGRQHYTQVGIKWDSGRTLQAVVPPDVISVVGRGP